MFVSVSVSAVQLLLKASEPAIRTASVALIRDYIAITLLLYTTAPVHVCVCLCMDTREQANVSVDTCVHLKFI